MKCSLTHRVVRGGVRPPLPLERPLTTAARTRLLHTTFTHGPAPQSTVHSTTVKRAYYSRDTRYRICYQKLVQVFLWYQRERSTVQETFMHVIKTVRFDWSIVLAKFPVPETCHELASDFWSKKLCASFWYTWPFDSLYTISYGCSICMTSTVAVHKRLFCKTSY